MIYLENTDATSDLQRRTIIQQNSDHIHMLIRRRTSGAVDKVNMVSRPGLLLLSIVIGSGSAHGEGDFGVGLGKRGIWGSGSGRC